MQLVAAQIAVSVAFERFQFCSTLIEFRLWNIKRQRAVFNINVDDITIPNKCDGPTFGSFRRSARQ